MHWYRGGDVCVWGGYQRQDHVECVAGAGRVVGGEHPDCRLPDRRVEDRALLDDKDVGVCELERGGGHVPEVVRLALFPAEATEHQKVRAQATQAWPSGWQVSRLHRGQR